MPDHGGVSQNLNHETGVGPITGYLDTSLNSLRKILHTRESHLRQPVWIMQIDQIYCDKR